MSFNFEIKLTETDTSFNKKVMAELLRQLNPYLRKKISPLRKSIGPIIADAVQNSKEVQSILYGNLSAELGFISPTTIAKQIYEAIRKSVMVEFTPFKYDGKNLNGNFSVVAIHEDFSDIITEIPTSSYTSNGHNIEWLKWLLFEGNNIIVADYQITYNPFKVSRSRSRRAIMEPSIRSSYQIPSKWSGTQYDNFITRSINPQTEQLIQSIMEKVLS